MIFLINSKTVTHNDIQSLPLVIKYTITLLLKEKFGYEIKDIMIIFDRTRDSLQKWLSKNNILDNNKVSRGSGFTSRNKSFIHISTEEDKYHISYFVSNSHESMMIDKKNSLISGETINSLTEKDFSKSKLGRLRKDVFTQDLYDSYNTKIIKHINRYLLEYKPAILKSVENKSFLWNENKLTKIIILLDKEGFSIPAINHIFSNISIHIKFPTVIQSKQEKQFDFIKYIWCSMTITRKKEIVDEITKIFNTTRKYTLEYIDLYSIFNEVLQSPYTVDKKIKKILFNVIDTKTYINTPISKTFNKKAIKDNEDDFLATTIYEFSYSTTKKSILDIFVNIVKSLYNILQFHLEFNEEETNHKMMALSEFKIKKYFSNPKEIKKFNIYYSNKDNCFKFNDKYDLDFHLSTTYSMTRKKKMYYLALDTEYVRSSATQNRLLSWQACISLDGKKLEKGYIRYIEKDEPRPRLQDIVVQTFNEIGIPPKELDNNHIVIICHYCPAEISMLSDNLGLEKFKDIKFLTANMEYVRKTLISLNSDHKNMPITYTDKDDNTYVYNWSYEFFDTKLIAPAGASSLDELSKTLDDKSLHKESMNPYEISHMDWVLKYKKKKFTDYAINDAKATLAVFLELQKSFRELEKSKNYTIKKTIGSAAVSYYTNFIKNIDKNLLKTILGKKTSIKLATDEKFSECYHGGRNETFWIGKAPEEYLYLDLDYKNAYPTCLSMLHAVDWELTPTFITKIEQLLIKDDAQLNATYVEAKFKFPLGTLFPCLPDFHEDYGLIYPLQGTTYTTAHEVILAHKMGAIIDIIDAKEMQPLKRNGKIYHPFKDFYKILIEKRADYPPKTMKNLLFKEYANTLYGKICQNVSKKISKGLYDDVSKELGPSTITSSAYAANVTGVMRSALGELLYTCTQLNEIAGENIYLPINAVTDGAMIGVKKSNFSAETIEKIESKSYKNIKEVLPEFIEKLEESKLIKLLKQTRRDITNNDNGYLEIKSMSDELWTFKTRGSVGYYKKKLTVLTKAGHRPPMIEDVYEEEMEIDGKNEIYKDRYDRPRTDEESAKWLLDIYHSLPEIEIYDFSRLITFKDLINTDNDYEDMINIISDRKTSLDFDYKRKPDFENEPVSDDEESSELININTIPFYNKDEMLQWRNAANSLRDSGKKDHVGGKYAGYRATPIKVHQKVSSKDRYGEKGTKGVIVNYVVHAYIKNKLIPYTCEYNNAQIANKFIDPKFSTKNKKTLFINREMIRNLQYKVFVPTKLVDNNFTRYWVKQTLRRLDVYPHDKIIEKLISVKR